MYNTIQYNTIQYNSVQYNTRVDGLTEQAHSVHTHTGQIVGVQKQQQVILFLSAHTIFMFLLAIGLRTRLDGPSMKVQCLAPPSMNHIEP